MPKVTFVQADGWRKTCEAGAAATVMDCALDNGVAGILAQCGGGCTCATCHCFIQDPWLGRLDPPGREEVELLFYLNQRRPTSRLACQIWLLEELDGLEVHLPAHQE